MTEKDREGQHGNADDNTKSRRVQYECDNTIPIHTCFHIFSQSVSITLQNSKDYDCCEDSYSLSFHNTLQDENFAKSDTLLIYNCQF